MTWDWRGYVWLAKRLKPDTCANVDEMALARSAISRAYYGAYHLTWNYVLSKGYPVPQDNDHKKVWNELMRHNYTAEERKIGINGSALMGYRKKADYNPSVVGLQQLAESAVIKVDELCALLTKLEGA